MHRDFLFRISLGSSLGLKALQIGKLLRAAESPNVAVQDLVGGALSAGRGQKRIGVLRRRRSGVHVRDRRRNPGLIVSMVAGIAGDFALAAEITLVDPVHH